MLWPVNRFAAWYCFTAFSVWCFLLCSIYCRVVSVGVSVVNLLLQYDWEFLLHDVLFFSFFSWFFLSSIDYCASFAVLCFCCPAFWVRHFCTTVNDKLLMQHFLLCNFCYRVSPLCNCCCFLPCGSFYCVDIAVAVSVFMLYYVLPPSLVQLLLWVKNEVFSIVWLFLCGVPHCITLLCAVLCCAAFVVCCSVWFLLCGGFSCIAFAVWCSLVRRFCCSSVVLLSMGCDLCCTAFVVIYYSCFFADSVEGL